MLQNEKAKEKVKSLHVSNNTLNSGFHLSVLDMLQGLIPQLTQNIEVVSYAPCALHDRPSNNNILIPETVTLEKCYVPAGNTAI